MAVTYPPQVFTEIIDFLTTAPSPEQIIAYEPSLELVQQFELLLDKNRHDEISETEKAELYEFMRLNHFINMLKIRARERLAGL